MVRQPDGTFRSSPWYVRFGKYSGRFRAPDERRVGVAVNGAPAAFHMHLSRSGEAFFRVEEDGVEGAGAAGARPASPAKAAGGGSGAGGGGAPGGGGGAGAGSDDDDAAFLSAGYSSLDDDGTSSGGSSIMRPSGWRRLASQAAPAPASGHCGGEPANPPPSALGNGGGGHGSAGALLPSLPPALPVATRAPPSARSPSPPPGAAAATGPGGEEKPPPGLLGGSMSPEPRANGGGRRGRGAKGARGGPPLLELSLCGAAVRAAVASASTPSHAAIVAAFEGGRVGEATLAHPVTGPATLADPDLLCALGGGSGLWPWHAAAPALAAAATFPGAPASSWRAALDGLVPAAVRGPSDAPLIGSITLLAAGGGQEEEEEEEEGGHATAPSKRTTTSWRAWLPGALSRGGTPAAEAAASAPRPPRLRHRRAFVPSPAQLAALNLQPGRNTLELASSRRAVLRAAIYAIPWHARLVISDIDGTVTRSDVLGHVLPRVGLDWSHSGIARLFTDVRAHGYLLLYLSSRSIAQAASTRDFLFSIVQEGGVRMPAGPVIISPQGLLPSLYREVILRRPHEFKIQCLEDVRRLFPASWNPFHSGFGNRDTDELSYLAVGLPATRVFIINPKGELRRAGGREVVGASLAAINATVYDEFPPLRVVGATGEEEWATNGGGAGGVRAPVGGDGSSQEAASQCDPAAAAALVPRALPLARPQAGPAFFAPPVTREEFSNFAFWRAPPPLPEDLLPLDGGGDDTAAEKEEGVI